jgi:hypothetical protein
VVLASAKLKRRNGGRFCASVNAASVLNASAPSCISSREANPLLHGAIAIETYPKKNNKRLAKRCDNAGDDGE